MINDPRNRQLVRRAIDALQLVSDEHQHHINCLATHARFSIGQLLKIGRTIDTLERSISELHTLLDQPPGVGGSEPPRLVPRPVRPVAGIAKPGLANAEAGDGGPAAA